MELNAHEAKILRPAIEARIEVLAPQADPANPWRCEHAAQEIADLRALLASIQAMEDAEAIAISDQLVELGG